MAKIKMSITSSKRLLGKAGLIVEYDRKGKPILKNSKKPPIKRQKQLKKTK